MGKIEAEGSKSCAVEAVRLFLWRKNIDITLVKIYNKRNVYDKKDRVDEVGEALVTI